MLGAMPKLCSCIHASGSWLLALLLACPHPVAAEPLPVPPPLDQVRTDCAHPQYASDSFVCDVADLRAADAEVAALASTPSALAADAVWEDQASWLRRRSLCAFKNDHVGCLIATYADRRAVPPAADSNLTAPTGQVQAW